MSKLHVEVCKIDKIENLENADRLQMATVKGWECLIGKDLHKEGDMVIFVPPDAVMPYDLIESLQLDYLKGHGRVRTVKLRGYLSQGLLLSLDILSPGAKWREGEDVAKVLGITKYEVQVKTSGNRTPKRGWNQFKDTFQGLLVGKITFRRFILLTFNIIKRYFQPQKKANPNFDVYTDIDNIKHYPVVFKSGQDVVITEKIHGTNFRAGNLELKETLTGRIKSFFTGKSHEFVYGSHRVQKTAFSGKGFYGEDLYGQIAEKYNLKDIIPEDYILYGEIYGVRVQELSYGLKDSIDVMFFDMKYKGKYVNWDTFSEFCEEYNLPTVPVLFSGKYVPEDLKKYTHGMTTLNDSPHIREGCVVKSFIEEYSNRCGRKILKSVSTDYLLTKKKEKPEEYVDDSEDYNH